MLRLRSPLRLLRLAPDTQSHMKTSDQSRFAALWAWALAALACLSIAPLGEAFSSRNSDEPQNGSGLLAANETIGTLPTWWVEDDVILPASEIGQLFEIYSSQVSFQAFVPEDEVHNVITDGYGSGFALLNHSGVFSGGQELIRVRVYGQIGLTLDLAAAGAAGVSTAAKIGSAFENGWVQWATSSNISSLMPVSSVGDTVVLDLQTPHGIGLLQEGALSLSCIASGDTSSASAKLLWGQVYYTQTL